MFSPLDFTRCYLHQTHLDHVSQQTSGVAGHILRPDPPYLSEHSSEHYHRTSPLPPVRAYDSLSIRSSRTRSSRTSSTSTTTTLALPPQTSTRSSLDQTAKNPILIQHRYIDKQESIEDSDEDTMAPKSGYYDSSHSSSDGDRVHHNPRREDRERSTASSTKKRTVVVTYGGKTGDPVRKADLDAKRWK